MSEDNTPDLDNDADVAGTVTAPYIVMLIQKDAVEHLPVVVHPHEVPVLALVHGEERLAHDEAADLPNGVTEAAFDPEDEYARIEQRYGVQKETGQTYAKLAFGGLDGFIDALERYSDAPRARGAARKTAAKKVSTKKAA